MQRGVKSWGLDAICGDKKSWTARNLVYTLIVELLGDLVDSFVHSLPCYIYLWFVFCVFFLLFDFYSSSISVPFLRFCGYIFDKPARDLTDPLGGTKWFKGLVAYANCNRDSYDSELGFKFLFSFCSRTSKSQVWGYLLAWFMTPFYAPIYAVFDLFNNIIFCFLICFL